VNGGMSRIFAVGVGGVWATIPKKKSAEETPCDQAKKLNLGSKGYYHWVTGERGGSKKRIKITNNKTEKHR